jgi:Protein of unknown function (DUF4232)
MSGVNGSGNSNGGGINGSGASGRGVNGHDPFEDSLAETWDPKDADLDRRLRALTGPVIPLHTPPYGFERVALRARRRRHRTAFLTATAAVAAVAAVAGGVLLGTRAADRSIETAGCNTVGQGAPPAAWHGGRLGFGADAQGGADGRSDSVGAGERESMNRKYEWAIGGVLTATALSAGIIAGCSNSSSGGPSADATESGVPGASLTPSPSVGAVTLPSSTTPAAQSPSPSSSALPLCVVTDLSPTVTVVAGSQGAGHESLNIALANTSGHTCTVYGFPGLQLEDRNSAGQATKVNRDFGVKPATLVVKNGTSVATTARIDYDIPAADEPQTGDCEAPSVYLTITPPEEHRQLSATIVGGPVTVCEHGAIDVLPFIAGAKGPNQ